MSHSEGQRESRVLADAAAAVRLTHARDVRQAQGLARHVDGGTDVLPCEQNSDVMVLWVLFSLGVELLLPFTKAVQTVVSVMCNLQVILIPLQ